MLLKIIPLLGVLFYASGAIRGETEPCDKLLNHPTIPVVEFKGNRETLQKATATSERFITLAEFPLVLIGNSDEPYIEILNDIVVVREGPDLVTSTTRPIPNFMSHVEDYLGYQGEFEFSSAVNLLLKEGVNVAELCPMSLQQGMYVYFWLSSPRLVQRLSLADVYTKIEGVLGMFEEETGRITLLFMEEAAENMRIVTYTREGGALELSTMHDLVRAYGSLLGGR